MSRLIRLSMVLVLGGFALSSKAEDYSTACSYLQAAFKFEGDTAPFQAAKLVDFGPNKFSLGASDTAWGGYYFPFTKGGIAARWQLDGKPFQYQLLNEGRQPQEVVEAIKNLPAGELVKLSPAEKFDIVMGHYDFKVTLNERKNRGPDRNPKPEVWEGFCNGRCAAAINLPEPIGPILVRNRDGIVIEVLPNDLKALGAASFFYVEKYAQLGSPSSAKTQRKLADPPNPGALDMALRGYLAGLRKGFVMDHHKGSEIWNVTIVGYEREVSKFEPISASEKKFAPAEAVNQVDVKVRVEYVDELSLEEAGKPTAPSISSGKGFTSQDVWNYRLYLDAGRNIVEGRFLNNRGPDFVWFAAGEGMESAYGVNPHLKHAAIEILFEYSQRSEAERRVPLELKL